MVPQEMLTPNFKGDWTNLFICIWVNLHPDLQVKSKEPVVTYRKVPGRTQLSQNKGLRSLQLDLHFICTILGFNIGIVPSCIFINLFLLTIQLRHNSSPAKGARLDRLIQALISGSRIA